MTERLPLMRAKVLALAATLTVFGVVAQGVLRAEHGLFWDGERFREKGGAQLMIRGVTYATPTEEQGRPAAEAECWYARDLPLIAASGANMVRTVGPVSTRSPAFKQLLETTGLYWLAGFPLEPYYDQKTPLVTKKQEILRDFREFALRFKDSNRLVGFVLGEDVLRDHKKKFNGQLLEYFELVAEAAAVIAELWPERPPALAVVVDQLSETEREVAGLSFWIWKAQGPDEIEEALDQERRISSRPVLVEAVLVKDSSDEPDGSTERASLASLLERLNEPGQEVWLGFLYGRYFGPVAEEQEPLFRVASPEQGKNRPYPELLATDVFAELLEAWRGGLHAEWEMQGEPELTVVENAASGAAVTSPGSLANVRGVGLAGGTYAANGVPWPLHQGEVCFCVDGLPAPIGWISPEEAVVQIPWEVQPGRHMAVLYRGGKPSVPVEVDVRKLAPGIFQDGLRREQGNCKVDASNGLRPGEKVTVLATGLGAVEEWEEAPRVYVNGARAEVLEAGYEGRVPGIYRLRIAISEETPANAGGVLWVIVGGSVSNTVPVRVENPKEKPGLTIGVLPDEVVLQAGGQAGELPVLVGAMRGYCGPVRLVVEEAPEGVVASAVEAGETGALTRIKLRALASAPSIDEGVVRIRASWPGVQSAEARVRVSVLPNRGQIRIMASSNGFLSGNPRAQFRWNDKVIFETQGGGPGRGINVLTADPETGVYSAVRSFDTWAEEQASRQLVEFLESLPEGTLVMFAVADEASLRLSSEARLAIARMFYSRYIYWLEYGDSWALIGRKGRYFWSESWSRQRGTYAYAAPLFPLP